MNGRGQAARSGRSAARLAVGLGWFSIGLGLVELMAPRATARAAGLRVDDRGLRAYGLREIVTGVGILASRNPVPWLWARVAGDALDLATLASRGRTSRTPTATAIAVVAGVAAVDIVCARAVGAERRRTEGLVHDYAGRRGLPLPPSEMRGAALADFEAPQDMITPKPLRAFETA